MHYPCSIISNVAGEWCIVEAGAAGMWGAMEEVTMVVQLVVCELGKVLLCHDRYAAVGDVREMWGWENTKVQVWWEVSESQTIASWATAMVDTTMPSIDISQAPRSCVCHLSTLAPGVLEFMVARRSQLLLVKNLRPAVRCLV
jgi:hypothetical protein